MPDPLVPLGKTHEQLAMAIPSWIRSWWDGAFGAFSLGQVGRRQSPPTRRHAPRLPCTRHQTTL